MALALHRNNFSSELTVTYKSTKKDWAVLLQLWHVCDVLAAISFSHTLWWWRPVVDSGLLPVASPTLADCTWRLASLLAELQHSKNAYQSLSDMATPPTKQSHLTKTVTPQPESKVTRPVQITDSGCVKAIHDATDLSDNSKQSYVRSLQRIVSGGTGRKGAGPSPALIPGASLLWCTMHPEQTCALLQKALAAQGCDNPKTLSNYANALRSTMAHHPDLAKRSDIRSRWQRQAETLIVTPLANAAKENRPSKRQVEGHVSYQEIAAKFRQLCEENLGSTESLVVGLIGLGDEQLLPQRRDYGCVSLYIGCHPTAEEASSNHLVVLKDIGGSYTAYIMLVAYTKTAKQYGPKRIELPLLYVRTLLESLHRDPRKYLFTMLQTKSVPANTPYTKANSFGKFANQTLKKVFGRPLTISGARHSYITHLHCSQYWTQLSDGQRESTAKQMCHSYSTACKYRFVMPAVAAPCTQNK
jgi:hypothetical protein